MTRSLYNEKNIIGSLYKYFSVYFENYSTPTAETLFLLILSVLVLGSAHSIRFLFKHFASSVTEKSLNAFYYACSYAKIDTHSFMNTTVRIALKLIPEYLYAHPVFLCIDDTMVAKFGKKFDNVAVLFDHAKHNGANYLNGHCFVSLMLCIPVWLDNEDKIRYISIPLGYRMWEKDSATKLNLAADMVRQVMPELKSKQVIILCDGWYVKRPFAQVIKEFDNLNLIGNARVDSAIYELPPAPTGKKGRPRKHGNKLSIYDDFRLSEEKIGDYYIASKKVITNIFDSQAVMAYVTASDKSSNNRRLFFSTIMPHELNMFCAHMEKAPLNQVGSSWMQYIPLFCYSFRWNIEISYYEQKLFWSLDKYMLRSKRGIETFINLINIAYCAMKILPYKDDKYSEYKDSSAQNFRFSLSEQIRQVVIFDTFVKTVENQIKSSIVLTKLKQAVRAFGCYL